MAPTETKLGKIRSVKFGHVGYQDCMMGLQVDIEMKGSGVSSGIYGGWITEITESTSWTEEDRVKKHGEMLVKLSDLLNKAKVDCVSKLKNIPVECTFDGMSLKSWRILDEVI